MGDADAFGHQVMQATVFFQKAGQPLLKYLVDGFLSGWLGKHGVEPGHRAGEAILEDDIVIALTRSVLAIGTDIVPLRDGVAQRGKLLQQCPFHIGFGQEGHDHSPSVISWTSGSLTK